MSWIVEDFSLTFLLLLAWFFSNCHFQWVLLLRHNRNLVGWVLDQGVHYQWLHPYTLTIYQQHIFQTVILFLFCPKFVFQFCVQSSMCPVSIYYADQLLHKHHTISEDFGCGTAGSCLIGSSLLPLSSLSLRLRSSSYCLHLICWYSFPSDYDNTVEINWIYLYQSMCMPSLMICLDYL